MKEITKDDLEKDSAEENIEENLWYSLDGPDNYSDRYLCEGVYVRKDGSTYEV